MNLKKMSKAKKLFLIAAVSLICILLATISLFRVQAGTLLFEDFQDSVANGFTVVDGTWNIITDGTLVYHSLATDPTSRVTASNTSWSNYTVDVKIKTTSWAGGSPGTAAIMARYQDTSNYYFFAFSGGNLKIKKQVAGVFTDLAIMAYTQTLNTWYSLRAEVNGTSLKLYVNGALKLSATDSSFTSGKAGILAGNGDTRYDDYTVNTIPALLYEDFEDNTANGWSVVDGTWNIITDGSQTYRTISTDATARSIAGNSTWSNYTIQVKIKTTTWGTSPAGSASVMARYQNTSNYYFFTMSGGNLKIKKQVAGVFTDLAIMAYTQNLNQWYTLKAELNGTSLKLYLDGVLKLSATDSSFTAGKVGLLGGYGDTRFDEYTVDVLDGAATPTPAPATPTPTPLGSVTYGYVPPAQTVHNGAQAITVPAGYIHQTAWDAGGGPDIQGVYAYNYGNFSSMVWRWADTMRTNSIQYTTLGGKPCLRFEVTAADHSSPGTLPDTHPRAEVFSVDNEEKHLRQTAPTMNVFHNGDEIWYTWAMYLDANFPLNHKWATLFQMKGDDINIGGTTYNWFTINAHRNVLDYSSPADASNVYTTIGTLSNYRGKWTRFTVHQKASTGSDGIFELWVDGVLKTSRFARNTNLSTVEWHCQFGYYRANEKDPNEPNPPGTGICYFTPLMQYRGSNPGTIPTLP